MRKVCRDLYVLSGQGAMGILVLLMGGLSPKDTLGQRLGKLFELQYTPDEIVDFHLRLSDIQQQYGNIIKYKKGKIQENYAKMKPYSGTPMAILMAIRQTLTTITNYSTQHYRDRKINLQALFEINLRKPVSQFGRLKDGRKSLQAINDTGYE